MVNMAKMKESAVPTMRVRLSVPAIYCLDLYKSKDDAPIIVGTANKNENSVAVGLVKPTLRPPIIVAAALDMPGIIDKH